MKPSVITVDDWLKAEAGYKSFVVEPQPPGSVTSEQYAAKIKRCQRTAQKRLFKMYKDGVLERERWNSPECGGNMVWVYWPKKK